MIVVVEILYLLILYDILIETNHPSIHPHVCTFCFFMSIDPFAYLRCVCVWCVCFVCG